MNLQLSEEQGMIRETMRKLVQDVVAPVALDNDERRRFVRAGFDALAEMGVLGLPIAEDAGGAGMGMLSFAVALEELGRACGSTARLLLSQTGQCATALAGSGAKGFDKLISGESVGAFVGREFGVRAHHDGDGWTLDGFAPMVTAAAEASLLVVAAEVTGEGHGVFTLDAGDADCQPVDALGFRATAPGSVRLDSIRCAYALTGEECAAALSQVDLASWIGAAAMALGSAEESVELARRHAEQRVAFGKPLTRQQAVRHKLVEGERQAEASRHLVYHAARLVDAGENAARSAIQARLHAVQAALLCADEGVQVHGGFGFTVEYHVERHYRDALALQVLEGGEESLLDRLA